MNAAERWKAVNDLFDAVADLPPDECAAALARYAGSPEVRDEVARLVRADRAGPIRLDTDVVLHALREAGVDATLAGVRLGPWHVVREIGRGGMGAVYEAFRADDRFSQRVAVKTLSRHLDRDGVARRFRQERQILASLQHANIAMLVDGGETEAGLPYLVMEYVDGVPIDRYCDNKGLTLRERIDLFREVCAAVQFAHRNLVVHRDIKPSNVLVTPDGGVKLLDFGIAKVLEEVPGGDGASITETGLRAFTTGYASPEQVRGQVISTSSDVYSLGVMLYLLLAGRLPVDVSDITPTEAIRRICDEPPPPPSRVASDAAARVRALDGQAALARELAGELDDIVLMALRKEPERRYATAAAFADDLKRYLQGYQVTARPDTWRYRVRSFSRRNPRLVAALGVAGASLAIGAVVAGWQARLAVRERDRARLESERSANVVTFLEQVLTTPTQAELSGATLALVEQAVTRAAAELGNDPLARAAVYRTAANAFVVHYRNDRARSLIDSAMVLDRRFAGEESTEVGRDLTVAAHMVYTEGKYDSAAALTSEAVRLLRRHPSSLPLDYPMALMYHGFASAYVGHDAEARAAVEEAIGIERQRPGSTLLPYLHAALAEAELFAGSRSAAARELRIALALYDSLPTPDPAERGIAELMMARNLGVDSIASAMAHARTALAIFEQRWGARHVYTAGAHATMGGLLAAGGDVRDGLREIDLAIDILQERNVGSLERATPVFERARLLALLGQWAAAESTMRVINADLERELGGNSMVLAAGEERLADMLYRQRRFADAEPVLLSAVRRIERQQGTTSEAWLVAARQLVALYGAMGRDAVAERYTQGLPPDTVAAIRARARQWAAVR